MAADSLDRLKSQLLTSGLQQENFALFQVVNQLIDYLRGNINTVNQLTGGGGGGGGGVGLLGATYLTKNKEVGLPNSLQTLPGAGIQFNDANGRRIISAALPFAIDGESGEDGPIGPPGIDGKIGVDGLPGRDGISMLVVDGEDGIDGDPGQPGATGGTGPTGPAGAPGIPGNDGLEGDIGYDGIPGAQGNVGATGSIGPIGFTGPIGPPGIDGEDPETPVYLPGPIGPVGTTPLNLLRTTANQTINAGAATYVDVTNLTFPVVNGVTYAFYFYVVFRSANTNTGWKAAVNCPNGTLDYFATGQTIANGVAGVATWLQRHTDTRDNMTQLTSTVTANVDLLYMVQGRYICTQNGTFAVRFANELAANLDLVVQAGSWGWWF